MAKYSKSRRTLRRLGQNISRLRIIRGRDAQRLAALGVIFVFGLIVLILLIRLLFSAFFGIRIRLSDVEAMRIPAKEITYIYEICEERQKDPKQALTCYMIDNRFFRRKLSAKTKEQLQMDFFSKMDYIKKRIPEKQFNEYYALIETITTDLKCFPLLYDNGAGTHMFGDTWSARRDMCATKNHKGCDIFDRENIPGRLMVVSMTTGTVENKGKNGRGGMYVGVRTERGSYYFYDNLESVTDIETGTAVAAGSPLGYMGNGGKREESDIKGYYPTNVHIGFKIRFDDSEIWVNPYPFLRYLEDKMYAEYQI